MYFYQAPQVILLQEIHGHLWPNIVIVRKRRMCEICLTVSTSIKIILVCPQCTVTMIVFEVFPQNWSLFDASNYLIITLFVDHYLLPGCVGEGEGELCILRPIISHWPELGHLSIYMQGRLENMVFIQGGHVPAKNYLEEEEEN